MASSMEPGGDGAFSAALTAEDVAKIDAAQNAPVVIAKMALFTVFLLFIRSIIRYKYKLDVVYHRSELFLTRPNSDYGLNSNTPFRTNEVSPRDARYEPRGPRREIGPFH